MQLGHYQDDKLFSRCHGETAAQFFRQKCCCLRERSCCMLILYIELWCYTWYMERPTGVTRGASGLLVSEDPLSNRDIPKRSTFLWHCSLPAIVSKNPTILPFMAVITTFGSERWCYPLKMLAVALDSLWWWNVWVSEGTLWSAVTRQDHGSDLGHYFLKEIFTGPCPLPLVMFTLGYVYHTVRVE